MPLECVSSMSYLTPLLLLVVEEQGCERLSDRDSGAQSQAYMTESKPVASAEFCIFLILSNLLEDMIPMPSEIPLVGWIHPSELESMIETKDP